MSNFEMTEAVIGFMIVFAILISVGFLALIVKCYKKIEQGKALIRNGWGGPRVAFSGVFVIPVMHRAEVLDLSVKRVEITRVGKDGLVCKDNMRADIKVAFFVRVNKTSEDALKVAQSLGCARASEQSALVELFDAKFSEALKTVGKQFDFVELYESREKFKGEILQIIGTDLNGFILDDCAIDYLEQTSLEFMNESNILDAEGIKKITELTAAQKILSNHIDREKEKTITQQDVEAREAILELNRQLAESEARQKREVSTVQAREQATTQKVMQEERLKAEKARILTDEEVRIAEENKDRQIIVAVKGKERTDAVESERVEKDRMLEVNERERIVTLAQYEKDKAIEEERKNIQDVIRDRVAVEKEVVKEEELIKDVRAKAEADRLKVVAVIEAQTTAEQSLVEKVKAAEALRQSAELDAKRKVIDADADFAAAEKKGEAMKTLAAARAVEEATSGMSEARVMEAKAAALEKQGSAEAIVIEKKATAEARGIEAKAVAAEKQGTVDASIMDKKFAAEANGIREKAEAMKLFDGVGREHEEYKLKLNKDKEIELAEIQVSRDIAHAQATVISEALKAAKIEIIGGETMFFDKLVNAVANGRSVDHLIQKSTVLSDVKNSFFDGSPDRMKKKIRELVDQFGLSSEDVKNLSIASLLLRLTGKTNDNALKEQLSQLLTTARESGLAELPAHIISE